MATVSRGFRTMRRSLQTVQSICQVNPKQSSRILLLRNLNSTFSQRVLFSSEAISNNNVVHPTVHVRRRGSFRSRFRCRLFMYGGLFASWMYFVDADFMTYFYDVYRIKYQKNNKCFENQTLWIVGASSGIGECLVYEAAQNKARKIIISARREKELQRVKNMCNSLYNECEVVVKPLDVLDFISNPTDHTDNDSQIRDMLETHGDIDILVLNTGLTQTSFATDTDVEVLKYLSNVNVFGPCAMATSMIRGWKSSNYINDNIKASKNKKNHKIVITSSLAGKIGQPQHSAYCMTKHAMNGYFESLRMEHYNDNINVNIICPGPVMTTDSSLKTVGHNRDATRERKVGFKASSIMHTQRCAQLYCTAITHNIIESWICSQPTMLIVYLRQYLPILLNPMGQLIGPSYMEKKDIKG